MDVSEPFINSVPMVSSWCSPGILGDYSPSIPLYIGISHRGTLVWGYIQLSPDYFS